VSLLMDALKKAEEAKRLSEAAARVEPQESPSVEAPAEAGEPAAASTGSRGLPELPTRLELLDAEFHTPAPKAPAQPEPAPAATSQAAAQRREQAAAQNLFEAKQPASRKSLPLIAGLAGLVAAIGIGIYFWWQLQPRSSLAPAAAVSRPMPPPAPIAAAPAPQPSPAVPAAAAEAVPVAPAPQAAPVAAAPVIAAPNRQRETPATASAKPAAAETDSLIRITKAKLQVHPQVSSGYAAFQAGDMAAAERDYKAVLKNEPKNTDALHGLAALSLRQGQYDNAETLYLRILEADPKDSAAQAGLIGLRGQVDPIQSESRLKNLLAAQPDSPQLNFALGNLYAQAGRWNDAQQAYFRAFAGDGDNPDYQFNLAISLDQLRQPKLALQYYQGALAAAVQRPAAFDKRQAESRVSELQK
jgi:tetratricopeptide (TPR) repeat protein